MALWPLLPALVAGVGDSSGRAPPHMGCDHTAPPRAARRVPAATRSRRSSWCSVVVPLSGLMASATLCPGFAAGKMCCGQESRGGHRNLQDGAGYADLSYAMWPG